MAAYRTIPNPVYTNYTIPNMATSNPIYSHKTTLCTYICSNKQIQSIFLQNVINYSTCTNVRRILLCSSVQSACTWKIVFKIENNELNELSECMLYKMFFFSGKHLKTVKLSLQLFSRSLACLLCLKVSKTFLKSLACLF